jgi:DNA replication and repair protein RecF
MKVQHVQLENFRNHSFTRLEFGSRLNVLLGRNGQGKTNILEAISCLSLTKSFYAASDITLVRLGQERLCVEGTLTNDAGIEYKVRVAYSRESGEKVFTVNGVRTERFSSVIGMFPLVILSPENNAITFGPPSERRKFIDLLLSQLSRTYFDDLLEYRQTLRQRNRILDEGRQHGHVMQDDMLEPWDQNLAGYGARIAHRRMQFVEEFGNYVARFYSSLVLTNEQPTIRYLSAPKIGLDESVNRITESILIELGKRQPEERRRGLTLVGPHRDDLVFQLNGIELQKYASQGQHKTFLIALKMAEFFYLKEKREEAPILLLDDVLGELDDERSQRLLSQVAELGQAVITTTNGAQFRGTIHRGNEDRRYYVEQGTCAPINTGDGKETAVGA